MAKLLPGDAELLLPGEEKPASLAALLSVTRDGNDPSLFHSVSKGMRAGNPLPFAYGGYIQGLIANAAAGTLPAPAKGGQPFALHALQGVFLGPTLTIEPVKLRVVTVRATRTFQTRHVTASQKGQDGQVRDIFFAIVDFHVQEAAGWVYGSRPTLPWVDVEQCVDVHKTLEQQVASGQEPESLLRGLRLTFGKFEWVIERRDHPDSVTLQRKMGIASKLPTSQDGLPLAQRTSTWWTRTLHKIEGEEDTSTMHRACLAFVMDSMTAGAPLVHQGRFFAGSGVQACTSLDVSLRVICSDFRMDDWILLEIQSEAGGESRTIPRCRAWRQDGRLIAIANQNSMLRFKNTAESLDKAKI